MAENKNNTLDQDLVGRAFLDGLQKERQDFICGAGKPRKKKLQVLPGDPSLSFRMKTSTRHVIIQDLCQKNKKRRIVSSSSSDGSDIMDLIDRSDSDSEEYTSDDSDGNGDNLHADKAV